MNDSTNSNRPLLSGGIQADSGATRKFGGAALGARDFAPPGHPEGRFYRVERSGPRIGVLVSRPGLPDRARRAQPQPASVSLPTREERPLVTAHSGSWRILIVEDNPVNQMVAARALRTLGYAPDVASSGEAALEALRQQPFDLILMDCQMPGMDGTRQLRKFDAARPVATGLLLSP